MAQNHVVDLNKNAELLHCVLAQFEKIISTSDALRKTFASKINELNDKTKANQLSHHYEFSMDVLNNTIKKCEKAVTETLGNLGESLNSINPPKSAINSTINSQQNHKNTNDDAALSLASTVDFHSDDEDDDLQATRLRIY